MKPVMKSLLLTALVATAMSSVPVSSHARRSQTLTNAQSSDAGTIAPQGAWRSAASVACAFGIRNGALSNPALASYTFGPCLLLLMDAIF